MGVAESDSSAETIAGYVRDLVTALVDRGLLAEARGPRTVYARNGAADPSEDDGRGAAMGPRLRQTVRCEQDESGRTAWFWVWAGPTRDSPPELEYLGPAAEIDHAADRVTLVLRLDGIDAEPIS